MGDGFIAVTEPVAFSVACVRPCTTGENLLGVVHADATRRCMIRAVESTSHKLGRADLGILNLGMESYCGSFDQLFFFTPRHTLLFSQSNLQMQQQRKTSGKVRLRQSLLICPTRVIDVRVSCCLRNVVGV